MQTTTPQPKPGRPTVYSKAQLIADIIRITAILRKDITFREYKEQGGRGSHGMFWLRFGSWTQAKAEASQQPPVARFLAHNPRTHVHTPLTTQTPNKAQYNALIEGGFTQEEATTIIIKMLSGVQA